MNSIKNIDIRLIIYPLFLMVSLMLSACDSGGSGGDSVFSCVYEESKTSCSSSSFSPWTSGCMTVDFELRSGLTPESYCHETFPSSDIACGGSCCIYYMYRNVSVVDGYCN